MNGYLKYAIKWIIRIVLHVFWILPVNIKKIYFISFTGLRYACNPKSLYLFLLHKFNNQFIYIWSFKDLQKRTEVPDATVVKTNSLKSVLEIMTSKYIIMNNEDIPWFIPLRKSQIVLETWHGGGAYKKVGVDFHNNSLFRKNQRMLANSISFYVSSCSKFTEIQSMTKLVPVERFIATGMPRNEIFFHQNTVLKKKIYKQFNLNDNCRIVMFAPTYRTSNKVKMQTLDFQTLIRKIEEKFGGNWKLFYRAHNYTKVISSLLDDSIIDCTFYDDMQELLYVSDMLITDYSSCMWDFALTGRPGFLYMPDLDSYINDDRGFFTNPDTWAYPYAKTEQDLYNLISNYEEKNAKDKIKKHLNSFGSYENVNSCEKVLEVIGII